MTDDDRIDYLMGEPSGALDDGERADLDGLRAVLGDPALWAAPPGGLGERVVAAIAAEAAGSVALAPRHRRPRRWMIGGLAVAAAALAVVLVGSLVGRGGGGAGTATHADVALAAVGSPGPSGHASLTRTDAGWRIELDVSGLARRDNGTYYQAWLKNPAGVLVPVGTFNQGGHVTLWAGVSPLDYPAFSVTVEAADGDQASSGQRVLAGTVRAAAR